MDHLAIAVQDTEQALKIWRDKLGLKVLYAEKVNGGSVLLTHLDLGNTQLQLLQPLDPHSALAVAVNKKGAHLHHFCLEVNDVEKCQHAFRDAGIGTAAVMHEGTKGKRALFINTNETDTVQVELIGE